MRDDNRAVSFVSNMRFLVSLLILFSLTVTSFSAKPREGFEKRIRDFIDTCRVFDTHEHLFTPEALKYTNFNDFTLLLQQNSYDDLASAGMPRSLFDDLFNKPLSPTEKWNIIKPYWKKSFNTGSNRVILAAIKDLYGIEELNDSTVVILSARIREAYQGDWFNDVLKQKCKIEYLVQEADFVGYNSNFIKYTDNFSQWININRKYTVDSLAACQVKSICVFSDFVSSLEKAFEEALEMGMLGAKVNSAYVRSLKFEDSSAREARRVFKTIMNGDESFSLSMERAKPLQDFMLHRLLELAGKHHIPVAFHTGLQAGGGNYIENSDPSLLTNLFIAYPDVNFVLYHGSYPFGGELSVLAKTFNNVFLDMNWTYSISPTYAARYLGEWLETVPVSKIMAFGGDQRSVENTYGELVIAREIIAEVLIDKVKRGYFSEVEAIEVARMILYENGVNFYKPQS